MLEELIATAGVWFFAACGAVFAAMFVEQAGAARSPEEDSERKRGAMLVLMLASLLAPGLLLLHSFYLTADDPSPRAALMAVAIAATLLGSMTGAIFGALARGAAPIMRRLALPLVLIALALAIYAAFPSIVALVNTLDLPLRPV
jgi:hypothetical protein